MNQPCGDLSWGRKHCTGSKHAQIISGFRSLFEQSDLTCADLKPFMDMSVMLCIEIKENLYLFITLCFGFFLSALISLLAMSLKRSETAWKKVKCLSKDSGRWAEKEETQVWDIGRVAHVTMGFWYSCLNCWLKDRTYFDILLQFCESCFCQTSGGKRSFQAQFLCKIIYSDFVFQSQAF